MPCPVSNVRRMSPRRASVRPKAFKCTHEPRSSAALFRVQRRTVQFVGVEVKSGSDDVALDAMWGSGPSSHVRYAVRDPNVHRHHPRLSLVGELRAACLDGHSSLQGDTSGAPWSVGCVAEHGARSSLEVERVVRQSRMHLGTVHVCLRVSNVRVITSRRAPQVGLQRRTKKTKKNQSRKSRRRCIVVASEKP